jgi:hypothetical protein
MRVVCLVALLLGLTDVAPSTPSGPATASSTPRSSSTASPAPHRPRGRAFVGEVVEISAGEGKIVARETLRAGSPKTTVFLVTPQTQILRGKDKATIADVRGTDHVTIKYLDGPAAEKRALSIRITPAVPAPIPSK